MLRSRPDRTSVHRLLAADREQLAWTAEDGSGSPAIASWRYHSTSPDAADDNLRRFKPGVIDVIAGCDVAQHWVQIPPASVASFAELRLVAQTRCAYLHGGTPAEWIVAADWHASRPFVCMGLPQDLVRPLGETLTKYRLVPRWHSAWSVLSCAAARAFPSEGWSAVRTPARVMLWHCSGAHVDCMASWAVSLQEPTAIAASRALQQVALEASRTGMDGRPLHWMDLLGDDDSFSGELSSVVRIQRDSRLAAAMANSASEAAAALAVGALTRRNRT